jgi:hypothetical protein
MGYDLHITRREHWCDEGNNIAKAEFLAYVHGDKEFTYPSALGDDHADWMNPVTGNETWLGWRDGQIETKNPEPEFVDKMVIVAKALKARVQGDDGEFYESSADMS